MDPNASAVLARIRQQQAVVTHEVAQEVAGRRQLQEAILGDPGLLLHEEEEEELMGLLSSYARNQLTPASTGTAAAATAQRLPSIALRLARHLRGAAGDLGRIAADPLAAYMLPEDPSDLLPPAECAFLRPGQCFQGRQVLMDSVWLSSKREQWDVTAAIHSFDPVRGMITGVLTAQNLPDGSSVPVTTRFEGEVIDNVNHSFYTRNCAGGAAMESDPANDLRHWGQFDAFEPYHAEVARRGGRCGALRGAPHIFMRWKETSFLCRGTSALTIAGFYFLCLNRKTGTLSGTYWDPAASPNQHLALEPSRGEGGAGQPFQHCELA